MSGYFDFLWIFNKMVCFFLCRIGALAKYRCERGYKIIGEPLVTCEETGVWSGQVPECICMLKNINKFSSFLLIFSN